MTNLMTNLTNLMTNLTNFIHNQVQGDIIMTNLMTKLTKDNKGYISYGQSSDEITF